MREKLNILLFTWVKYLLLCSKYVKKWIFSILFSPSVTSKDIKNKPHFVSSITQCPDIFSLIFRLLETIINFTEHAAIKIQSVLDGVSYYEYYENKTLSIIAYW